MKLNREFYSRPTVTVAQELLGKYLVFKDKIGKIIETEAYLGPEDLASHARFKSRKRNYLMFGEAGVAYVYFIYGIYHMLNIVTEPKGIGGAVLIRSLKKIEGIEGAVDGPGKLTETLGITYLQNGLDLTGDSFYIEERGQCDSKILATPRIGIDYAGPYKEKLWRFILT